MASSSPPRIVASALIPLPADRLYGCIADYRTGHGRILPRPPFESLVVEEGGTGAGTTIRVALRVLGVRQSFRAVVTEPEPGRVLEEETDTGWTTTFTVEPEVEPGTSRVTIESRYTGTWGLRARLESRLTTRLMTPVFRRELELLERVVASGADSA